jgi:Zn-dependent protease with chaperone function
MKKTMICLLAYILQDSDREAFITRMEPITKGIDNIMGEGKISLKRLDIDDMSLPQRYLAAIYLHLYCLLHDMDITTHAKLIEIRKAMNLKDEFVALISDAAQNIDLALLKEEREPIVTVLEPSDRLIAWATQVCNRANSQGNLIAKKVLGNLHPQEYEHPLDKKCLNALQGTPGFETVYRKIMEYYDEPLMLIKYTGSNIEITETAFPKVHRVLQEACETLNLTKIPRLYCEQGFINAFVSGADNPIISLTSGCLGLLDHDELLFIIGHEIGHIKSQHVLYRQMSTILPILGDIVGGLTLGLGGAVASGINIALLNWMRMSEFSADRAGLLCCQDPQAAYRAMMKTAGCPPMLYKHMDTSTFLEQARKFKSFDSSIKDKVLKMLSIMDDTHPWTVMRAKELLDWVEEGSYQRVFNRETYSDSFKHEAGVRNKEKPAEQQSPYCAQCGASYLDGARFCMECGEERELASA